MAYKPPTVGKKKRCRQRRITWFNPLFSKTIKGNVGSTFLSLVDKHFPKESPLHKFFNRTTIKISYSTVKNIRAIINSHNRRVLNPPPAQNIRCNCRKKQECPLNGQCLIKNIVYQADVTSGQKTKTYYGLTSREFKSRWYEHRQAIKNKNSSKATELSNYIWSLKSQNKEFTLKFKIKSRACAYSSGSRHCQLCLREKMAIALEKPSKLLNSRREIMSKCIHKGKFELRYCKKPP